MQFYRYRGKRIHIVQDADLPPDLRPGGKYEDSVRQLLDSIQPWEGDQHFAHTEQYENVWSLPLALPIKPGGKRVWGIHVGHKASNPQLSPFVDRRDTLRVDPEVMRSITIELSGTTDDPRLVRGLHGKRTPPIPSMSSARHWPYGGMRDCLFVWRRHGHLLTDTTVVPGTLTEEPPEWFFAT